MNIKNELIQLKWNINNILETSNNLIKKIDFMERVVFNDYLSESEKSNYIVDGLLFLNNQSELLVDRNRFINNQILRIEHYLSNNEYSFKNELENHISFIKEKLILLNETIDKRLGLINLDAYESNKVDNDFTNKIENIFCKWFHYQASKDNLFANTSFSIDKLVDIVNALKSNIKKQIQGVKVYCKVIIKNIESFLVLTNNELVSDNELEFEILKDYIIKATGFKFGESLIADYDYINLYKSINNINNQIDSKNITDEYININPELKERINHLIFKHYFFNRLDGIIRVDNELDGLNWLLKSDLVENDSNNIIDDYESISNEIDCENEYIENLTNGDNDENNEW